MSHPALVPELAERLRLIAGVPPFGARPPSPEEIVLLDSFCAAVDGYAAPEALVEEFELSGPHGPVRVRAYRPLRRVASHRGLVWAHGGAFLGGDLDMPEADCVARELVSRTSCVVVSVDYRLCVDGVHFPVPHDELHTAFIWAATKSDLLPDGSGWAIGGASAGANLALGAAERLRDEGGVAPIAVLLAYPVVHEPVPPGSSEHAAKMATVVPALRFSPESTEFFNRNYLGPHPLSVPYAFPGMNPLEGLPPVFISLCEYDDLTPSGERLATDLRTAGVEVIEDVVAGVPHGHLNIAGLPSALNTVQLMGEMLERSR